MSDVLPILLLTRPRAGSQAFWEMLPQTVQPRLRCLISPLIEITHRTDLPDLRGFDGIIATSAHAIAALTAQNTALSYGMPCYCVGQATARAAQSAGLTAISADGDADALVDLVAARAKGQSLIHLHGAHTRGNVAERLSQVGVQTQSAVVYDQSACALSDSAQAALFGPVPVISALFSPRTAALFAAGYRGTAPLYIAGISAAVAQETLALTPKRVITAQRPTAQDMVQAVERLALDAGMVEG